jgi:DNA repair protein RadA/Sms
LILKGKSTLMLQVAGAVASLATPQPGIGMGLPPSDDSNYGPVWYVSGEENSHQIASRALRLGIQQSELWLLPETHVDTICEKIVASYHPIDTESGKLPIRPPSLLVIDSIQTMICDSGGSSAAGGVTQVRECVGVLLRLAKSTGIPVFLVGHVTKSGDVAGPRTVEHMVDCVLYLEGGDHRTVGDVNLRMLRATKNRFGSSDELGVYEMTSGRLLPVRDPSSLFLSTRLDTEDLEGCSISIVLEGLRSMTVEIQALVTSNMEGKGRRTVNGFAYNRLQLILGVLQKRCGMFFGKYDVYLNVVGNMRLDASKNEGSASDLAVSLALVSSLLSIPVRSDTAFVGEVGLLGEIRSVPVLEKRLQEAQRMGFSRVITPRVSSRARGKAAKKGRASISRLHGVEWIQCDTLLDAINQGLIREIPKRQRRKKAKKVDYEMLEDSVMKDDFVILDGDDDNYDNDDDDDDDNNDTFGKYKNSFFE